MEKITKDNLPRGLSIFHDYITRDNTWLVSICYGDTCPLVRAKDINKDVAEAECLKSFNESYAADGYEGFKALKL